MIDTDTVFNGDPAELFRLLDRHDLALTLGAGRFQVRNKIMAGYVGAAATQAARGYLRRLAGYVGAYWEANRLTWGVDQVAMYAVLRRMPDIDALRVVAIPPRIASPHRAPDAVMWPAKR